MSTVHQLAHLRVPSHHMAATQVGRGLYSRPLQLCPAGAAPQVGQPTWPAWMKVGMMAGPSNSAGACQGEPYQAWVTWASQRQQGSRGMKDKSRSSASLTRSHCRQGRGRWISRLFISSDCVWSSLPAYSSTQAQSQPLAVSTLLYYSRAIGSATPPGSTHTCLRSFTMASQA